MNKTRSVPILASLFCILTVLAVFVCIPSTAHAESVTLRLGGKDRISTAIRISDAGWGEEGASVAVIANGYSYPDAMAGVPLAAMLDAPVLLTKGSTPEADLLAQLEKLHTTNVVILGGESRVSADFISVLQNKGLTVERISGSDRYATASSVAARMLELGAAPEQIFIASGANYPDALSISPAAGVLTAPILYARPDGTLSDDTAAVIRQAGMQKAVIVGGTSAVPEQITDHLLSAGITNTQRLSGTDRYQTSLAINRHYSNLLSGNAVALASGENFPDALSGSAFAAKKAIPIMLVSNRKNIAGAYDFLTGRNPSAVYIFGLEGAISSYAANTFLSGGTITTAPTTTTTAKPTTTTKKPQNTKKAYLTFDDGPSANTKKILNILDQYNVKATFFVIYRKGYESVYKDIVKRGHTIALHSYTHSYSDIYSSSSAYFKDLNRLSDYVYKVTGVRSKIMRFPGGGSNTVSRKYSRGIMTTLTKEVQKKGYRYYDWNVDSQDASGNLSASAIVNSVKRSCGSQKSAIVLMHDAPGKASTVTALPDIIRYLRSKGYDLLPITESTPQVHHAVNN